MHPYKVIIQHNNNVETKYLSNYYKPVFFNVEEILSGFLVLDMIHSKDFESNVGKCLKKYKVKYKGEVLGNNHLTTTRQPGRAETEEQLKGGKE